MLYFIKIQIVLTFSLFSFYVNAKTELLISPAFNIKAVNGVIYSEGIVNQNRRLNLREGKNLIVIEYEEVFEDENNDNFDIIKSSPFLLNVYLQKNTQYRQQIVKPANADAARKYINNPLFKIVNLSNHLKKTHFNLTPLTSNSTSYLIHQTRLRKNNTLDLSHPNPKVSQIENKKITNTIQKKSLANKMLHYWWQQATGEEKKLFLKSINQD